MLILGSLGEIKVPSEHCWGAQTQRSLENFKIGIEKMPLKLQMIKGPYNLIKYHKTLWITILNLHNCSLSKISAKKPQSLTDLSLISNSEEQQNAEIISEYDNTTRERSD
ncbi:hypothetical protein X798_07744 [Onchocerca flexuosa]|uniref:Uncharacterized protein n=2 Tax=Onchocerca flexuosa TaxID=387005 RepID=A0A183H1F5_9BILA|nr:hypothetical protein X798_07744 [Onchocerca flexuosa]VDO29089.1 unnamed protein product [Onchocerca flexuosa]